MGQCNAVAQQPHSGSNTRLMNSLSIETSLPKQQCQKGRKAMASSPRWSVLRAVLPSGTGDWVKGSCGPWRALAKHLVNPGSHRRVSKAALNHMDCGSAGGLGFCSVLVQWDGGKSSSDLLMQP